MRIKQFAFPIFLFFTLALAADLTLVSCASRGAPGGGAKDTVAPKVDTTFPPNFTTSFNSSEIEIIFEEYIALKSASQQISITPPLSEKLDIKAGSKSITIQIPVDSLLPNTTYIISFGTAITDFTEGNVNGKFKYVFSTGTFIDSLSLSGSIINKEGAAVPEMLVALYDYATLKRSDSIPFLTLPTYYTYTDESGAFELSNLKYGNFHAVAFIDKGGRFKMQTGKEQAAFSSDTIRLDTNTKKLNLQAFTPEDKPRFVNARHTAPNKIRLVFNGDKRDVEISRLFATENKKAPDDYIEKLASDTVYYWFKEATDSIVLRMVKPSVYDDTAIVKLREYPEAKMRFTLLEKELVPGAPLTLQTNIPFLTVSKDGFLVFTNKDTLANLQVSPSDSSKKILYIKNPPKAEKTELVVLPNAVTPFSGIQKDTVYFSYKHLAKQELGNAIFTVVADSNYQYILNIITPENKVLLSKTFTGKTSLNLKNLVPKKYTAQLIVDADRNGKWSSGNYLNRKQPERIIKYNDAIEIRANWDLEIEWQLTEDQLSKTN